jgi:hypothetical protein
MIGGILALVLQAITVGGWDKAPPKVLGTGGGLRRATIARDAKECGIPAWEYDGAIWAHSGDLSSTRLSCLRRKSLRRERP